MAATRSSTLRPTTLTYPEPFARDFTVLATGGTHKRLALTDLYASGVGLPFSAANTRVCETHRGALYRAVSKIERKYELTELRHV